MKISLNQIFWTSSEKPGLESWDELTSGRIGVKLNTYSGMPYFKSSKGAVPMINFHINPEKAGKKETPWRDIVMQDEGRIIYNGDNNDSDSRADEKKGNKVVLRVLGNYVSGDRQSRLHAPPIIVTQKHFIDGKGGFKKFLGYGLITQPPKLVQQYERGLDNIFSNYQFEVTLFKLGDGEEFDWRWIDDRRDDSISLHDSLKHAPKAWKAWVEKGNSELAKCQLRILNYKTLKEAEQRKMPKSNRNLIDELLNVHYPASEINVGLRFEAMASFITQLFFEGHRYRRGWITKGSGDRGVDFVGRLDIGEDDFANSSLIVLGQSKRFTSSIGGEQVTRIASRMTRGYLGVVVTLDVFTVPVQHEIKDDKLPIIMLNGKKVSELLLRHITLTGKSLEELVQEQDEWASNNFGDHHYDTILSHD